MNKLKNWWSDKIDDEVVSRIINIYNRMIANDNETKSVVRVIKEMFNESLGDHATHFSPTLSKLVDKYLIVKELEKKKNAEVSTPYELRQEMLDKVWYTNVSIHKILCIENLMIKISENTAAISFLILEKSLLV